MVSKEEIVEALKKVNDPELHIDIWTLELILDINLHDDNIDVEMTFTSPGCPYGPALVADVKQKLKDIPGVKEVKVEVILDPPWQPSEDLRALMGV
jgi:metal-sulfur cluster biosynthetic enzyme